MPDAVRDEYRERLPGCSLAQESDMEDWRKIPISLGYRWVIVPEVNYGGALRKSIVKKSKTPP